MIKNKRIISITAIIIFTLTMFSINVYAGSGSSKLQSTEHESKQSRSTNDVFELEGSCGENVRYLFNSETGKLTIFGRGTWRKVNGLSGLGKLVKSVIIEEEVNNIPCAAFVGCINLTSVTIPNSVTEIDNYAFYGCESLKEITIPGSVALIGDHAFSRCNNLASVTYLGNTPPDYPIGSTYIFEYCPLSVINVPYDYEGNDFCRYGGKIKKGSKTIDYESKRSNSTNNILELKGSCGENIKYLFNPETGELTISGRGTWSRINVDSFRIEQIKSIIIEEGVNNIPSCAFEGCTNLTSVTIPNSVTQIDSCAFRGCKNLKEIVIPGSVVRIGSHAFYWCRNLDSVTYLGNIPPNSSIENTYIFGYCSFFDGKAVNVPYNYEGTTFCGCKIRKGSV